MSLAQSWTRFLASPKLDALSEDATMTYITSCKQFSGAKDIIRQLQINTDGLKSVKDTVISSHETNGVLINEVASSFVFEFDGQSNPFLPGIDDNMYSGKKVEVPMIYVVTFEQEKIHSVRIFWDQATVLKQIEVIGARGRGWPVFDGTEQNRLMKQAVKPDASFAAKPAQTNSRPGTATRDPHATLHLGDVPVEERGDYGPQEYNAPVKPSARDYNELFIDESTARPDEMLQRQGQGKQRQVTLGQSQFDPERGIKNMNFNESRGHELRNSHFEFGTPDANDSDSRKNEIPAHAKGAIRDHNRSTEDDDFQHFQTKARPDMVSAIDLSSSSPTPPTHNAGRRGPPQASYDAFDDAKLADKTETYNLGRRPPPQSQYDFVAADDTSNKQPMSRAASAQYNRTEEKENFDIHGRDGYNKARRPPPQSQYDFMSAEDSTTSQQPLSRAASAQFAPTADTDSYDMHGRDGWNKGRRAPPQAQYDFVGDSASQSQEAESFGRASTRRFASTAQDEAVDIHGRDGYNKGRRAPPSASYEFMSEQSEQPRSNFGRSTQRNFTPSYELGEPEAENIHNREYNMSRRGPPQPQTNFLG